MLGNVRVKDELIVDQKEKEQLHEKTGFKICALPGAFGNSGEAFNSPGKANAKNKELVNRGGIFRRSHRTNSNLWPRVVDAFTLYLKSEEQHLKNENERLRGKKETGVNQKERPKRKNNQ